MKYCLDCGGKLAGRLDKKFCGDYCRSHYHNERNRQKKDDLHEINTILKANTNILKNLIGKGLSACIRAQLLSAGFHFGYFTSQVNFQDQIYFCCYHYGYSFLAGDILILKVFDQHKIT